MRISDWSSDVCSSIYRGPDDAVHSAKDFTFRSTFSLWDTFRAQHTLLTLVQPDTPNSDIVKSLVASRKARPQDRKRVVEGTSVSVREDIGGSRINKKKTRVAQRNI